ncbi:hypothetical protein RhiirA5_400724 [Rhizophagus irregularis]|uniref:RNase H type-1 domain-containing protein n=1 Tax=Rhizophagus irregularis TaxID=588596 RepID=A0A2N0PG58_9GLOM|nr:hypothetical protein RhiirA5_400724 [Rhizophagus irregularis]
MGILTALMVSPFNCRINIYTDSANCITIFNTHMQSGIASPRQKLKQSNFLIWDLIFFLIEEKQLLVTLHKVSGHSNNPYNDEADSLAKAGAHIIEPIIVNHKFFSKQSLVKQWESTLSITKNKKRFYRKRHKKRTPPPPDPGMAALMIISPIFVGRQAGVLGKVRGSDSCSPIP